MLVISKRYIFLFLCQKYATYNFYLVQLCLIVICEPSLKECVSVPVVVNLVIYLIAHVLICQPAAMAPDVFYFWFVCRMGKEITLLLCLCCWLWPSLLRLSLLQIKCDFKLHCIQFIPFSCFIQLMLSVCKEERVVLFFFILITF